MTTLVRFGESTPYFYSARLDEALRAAEGDIDLEFWKMHVHSFPSFRGLSIVSLLLDSCRAWQLADLVIALEGNNTLRTLKLTNLELRGVDLASLGSLNCGVQRLELRSCVIEDARPDALAAALAALVDLPLQALAITDLNFHYGLVSRPSDYQVVTASIERTEILQELDIGGNHADFAEAVCQGLFCNRSIRVLTVTRPRVALYKALAYSNRSLLQVNFVDDLCDRAFMDKWLAYNRELKEAKKSMAALVFAWEQGNQKGLGMLPPELFIHVKEGLYPTSPADYS